MRKSAKEETEQDLIFRNQFIPERENDEHYRELAQKKIQCGDQVLKRFDALLNNGTFEYNVSRRVKADARTEKLDKK